MRSANYASALVCAMALAMACTTLAQNSPQDFVDGHNSARAAVGVGPVSWDDNVAAYAENHANQRIGDFQLVHSDGPYGDFFFSQSNLILKNFR
ncbi:basic form of pathogenesis-related protein 1-like [Musa troglodytarum]|uniref:Basic form of pathogenesis-related protein 1-like n=1 Tax=Musa troglodytarum TaxID=320322 RepID=A0A9E7EXB2_9LILI|nr:basic form of pathogenesis-related protein 1-like [Musa troglodytarum]